MPTMVRVINEQLLVRSILIDKIDRSQGNFSHPVPYAQSAKQKVYVPYVNPLDTSVPGYIDMVPTDEVLLALNESKGVLSQLAAKGYVSTTLYHSALIVTPTVTAASNATGAPIGGQTGVLATTGVAVSGVQQVTGLTGMTAGSVGHSLTLSGVGAAATITVALGVVTVTGLTGMAAGDVGGLLTITSSSQAANIGSWPIASFISASSVTITNGAAVSDTGSDAWHIVDPTNAGTFTIVSYTSATHVGIANASGTSDTNNGHLHWVESTESGLTITGTTFLSLAPDHTYVTITNLSGASQIITDSAIISAGAPSSIGATSIVIADALVTIGTPTTGWKVTVQANSKKSNTFTL
jgi:hypothetical protein